MELVKIINSIIFIVLVAMAFLMDSKSFNRYKWYMFGIGLVFLVTYIIVTYILEKKRLQQIQLDVKKDIETILA